MLSQSHIIGNNKIYKPYKDRKNMNLYRKEQYRGYSINIYYDNGCSNPREWDNIATFVCEHSRYKIGDRQDVESCINDLFYKYVSNQSIIEYFVKRYNAHLIVDENGCQYYECKRKICGDEYTYYIGAYENCSENDVVEEMTLELSIGDKLQLIEDTDEVVMLGISMYEHGGITLWLGSIDNHPDSRWDCSSIGFAYVEKSVAEQEAPRNIDWKKWAYDRMEEEMEIYDDYVKGDVYGYTIEDENGNVTRDSCWGFYGNLGEKHLLEQTKYEIDEWLEYKECCIK